MRSRVDGVHVTAHLGLALEDAKLMADGPAS